MKDQFPQRIDKPWGYELLFAKTPKYAGKLIFVKKRHRLSFQYHREKDETIFIHSGIIEVDLENDAGELVKSRMGKDQCYRIFAGKKHRLTAISDTVLFEVSTPELDDVVIIEDDYGRT